MNISWYIIFVISYYLRERVVGQTFLLKPYILRNKSLNSSQSIIQVIPKFPKLLC